MSKDDDDQLSLAIKVKFGTAPNNPTDLQLARIKADLKAIVDAGRKPTEAEWKAIVGKHCPQAGHYKYSGMDNTDLNVLLSLATKK